MAMASEGQRQSDLGTSSICGTVHFVTIDFTGYLPHCIDALKVGVAVLLKDNGFKLSPVTTVSTMCLHTAKKLMEWMDEPKNHEKLQVFSAKVMASLRGCVSCRSTSLSTRQKEAMCHKYHNLRIPPSFQALWKAFVSDSVGVDVHPMFYQYVTDQVFETFLKMTFKAGSKQPSDVEAMAYEEANALRYVAGYVCRKVQKRIEASKHPMRDRLLLCLMDLCDEDDEVTSSAEWVHAVDRGGLVRVSETTYMVFERMEMIIRSVFNTETAHELSEGTRKELRTTITTDEDLAFLWCMLTVEVEEAEGAVLLEMLTDLFITVRGFSFSKSVMELYKQTAKKSTQKSKSLRRKLVTSDNQ